MLPTAGPAEAAIAGLIRLDPISAKTTGNLLQELKVYKVNFLNMILIQILM